MTQTITEEMVEAAMRETPFIPNENNQAWMVRALSAALALSAGQAQPDELWENFQSRRFLHGHRETPKESFSIVFSALVPPAVPGEVRTSKMKRIYDTLAKEGGGTWATYMMMEIEEAFSVPLPEIEGGDKGDGWDDRTHFTKWVDEGCKVTAASIEGETP